VNSQTWYEQILVRMEKLRKRLDIVKGSDKICKRDAEQSLKSAIYNLSRWKLFMEEYPQFKTITTPYRERLTEAN